MYISFCWASKITTVGWCHEPLRWRARASFESGTEALATAVETYWWLTRGADIGVSTVATLVLSKTISNRKSSLTEGLPNWSGIPHSLSCFSVLFVGIYLPRSRGFAHRVYVTTGTRQLIYTGSTFWRTRMTSWLTRVSLNSRTILMYIPNVAGKPLPSLSSC